MSERIRIEWTQENADKLATELRELVAERDRYRAALEEAAHRDMDTRDLAEIESWAVGWYTDIMDARAALDPTEEVTPASEA